MNGNDFGGSSNFFSLTIRSRSYSDDHEKREQPDSNNDNSNNNNNNNNNDDDDDDSNHYTAATSKVGIFHTMTQITKWMVDLRNRQRSTWLRHRRPFQLQSKTMLLLGWLAILLVVFCLMSLRRLTLTLPSIGKGPTRQHAATNRHRRQRQRQRPPEAKVDLDSDNVKNWTLIWKRPTRPPYTVHTPHINVLWSRGWYNAVPPPKSIPMDYYNGKWNTPLRLAKNDVLLRQSLWNPSILCGYPHSQHPHNHTVLLNDTTNPQQQQQQQQQQHLYLWLRSTDMALFANHLKDHSQQFLSHQCQGKFSIINSDGDDDVSQTLSSENSPIGLKGRIPDVFQYLVQHPAIDKWYAQNLMEPASFTIQYTNILDEEQEEEEEGDEQEYSRTSSTGVGYYDTARITSKLVPIPVGLELHTSLKKSWMATLAMTVTMTQQHPIDIIKALQQVRDKHLYDFTQRRRGILVDFGSVSWCQRRIKTRTWLKNQVLQTSCGLIHDDDNNDHKDNIRHKNKNNKDNNIGNNNRKHSTRHHRPIIYVMPRLSRTAAWDTYATYQFAVAPAGCGWDTHRLWELLFLGTIPIVLAATALEQLLIPAHVPALVVDDWKELCNLVNNGTLYDLVTQRYQDWIRHAHHWLRPSIWIPRDQHRMDFLCRHSPGCLQAYEMNHRITIKQEAHNQAGGAFVNKAMSNFANNNHSADVPVISPGQE